MVKRGDNFRWKWNNWNFEEVGKIFKANDQDLISFTFAKGGYVHIALKPAGNGTELVLTQDNIP